MEHTLTISPTVDDMPTAAAFLRERLSERQVAAAAINTLLVVLDELLSNIVHYSGATFATIDCVPTDDTITLRLIDDGIPFDPRDTAFDPDRPAEEQLFGGMGLAIVKNSVDRMDYCRRDERNIVTLQLDRHHKE